MKAHAKKACTALALALMVVPGFAAVFSVTGPGTYVAEDTGTEFVISGTIEGDVAITAATACQVTLSGTTISGALSIDGDVTLNLDGANAVTTSGASAITCTGALAIAGDGALSATAAGAKKTGVIVAADFTLVGGTTTVTILNPSKKNACGVSLSGNYVQAGGTLKVIGSSNDYKQNGVFLATKQTTATISGGMLDVTLAGEKSVGLAMDKATISGTMTGGALVFAMSGDGAKGVKGDGSFTMAGGTLDATLSGGVTEDYFEYEDDDGNAWNYYVTLTSSTKTSGGTSTYSTSSLIANGTYPVMDTSKCYAVKVGTLNVSGGTMTVKATGTAGRGLGADSMTLSGGTFDITVTGGPTDVYVESLVDSDDLTDSTYASGVTTCLDSGGAACIKTGDDEGTLTISGGEFSLKATGDAGKLINAAGYLVIGTEGQETPPDASQFSPDIRGYTTGSKVYCTAIKQKYYGVLATAAATSDISSMTLSVAADNLVASSSSRSASRMAGPGGGSGGGDDNADYSNPKGIKGVAGVTVHGGRIAVTTKNDGGEGLESKDLMTINGGVLDLQCYDDAINSGGNLVINGGYIYAGSSGNDAIDSNANIYMTGGIVLAFSTAGGAEVGIDTDNSNGLIVSGGHLVATGGAAGNMVIGSSGTQKTYKNASVSASTYSGKYLSMTGSDTFTVKMPSLSGTISLVCTTEGWATAGTPKALTSAPTVGSIGFRDIYLSSYSSDGGGGGDDDDDDDNDVEPVVVESTLWPSDGVFDGSAAHVYDGWIMNENGTLAGTIQIKTTKANTKTHAFTATATVKDSNAKSWRYTKGTGLASGPMIGQITGLTCSVKNATVSSFGVTLGANGMSGTWGGFEIRGARNGMGTSGDAMKATLESSYKKSWTTAFADDSGTTRLRFVVGAKGATKITGIVASNLMANVSVQAVMGEEALYVPCLATVKNGNRSHAANMLLAIAADGTMSSSNASFGDLVAGGVTATGSLGEISYVESCVSKGGEYFSGTVVIDDLAYPAKFTASGLPTGLKINASTGEIYGTPTKPGSYTATITVTSIANSRLKATTTQSFDIANYTDDAIPVSDTYEARVGVKIYKELADVVAGCTVIGLPAGLKFATTATMDKTYGFGPIPAYTIYGVPTKSGDSTVYFKKSGHTASSTFTVAALDDWAKGTFNGAVLDKTGTNITGLVSAATVSTVGKISGKMLLDGLIYTLTAPAFDSYDADSAIYSATVVGKSGKLAVTNTVAVAADGVGDSLRGVMSDADTWIAWQNLWKADPWKTVAKNIAGTTKEVDSGVSLKFGSSGTVTATGIFEYENLNTGKLAVYKATCSTILIPGEDNTFTVFVYFPAKTTATMSFPGYSEIIAFSD